MNRPADIIAQMLLDRPLEREPIRWWQLRRRRARWEAQRAGVWITDEEWRERRAGYLASSIRDALTVNGWGMVNVQVDRHHDRSDPRDTARWTLTVTEDDGTFSLGQGYQASGDITLYLEQDRDAFDRHARHIARAALDHWIDDRLLPMMERAREAVVDRR